MTNGRAVCDSHHINEELLADTFAAAIQDMIGNADDIIDTIEGNIKEELLVTSQEKVAAVDAQIVELQGEALALHKLHQRGGIKGMEYDKKVAEFHRKMDALEEQRKTLQTTETQFNKIKLWIDNFREMVTGECDDTDPNTMIRSLTEQIIIYESYMEIRLKSLFFSLILSVLCRSSVIDFFENLYKIVIIIIAYIASYFLYRKICLRQKFCGFFASLSCNIFIYS